MTELQAVLREVGDYERKAQVWALDLLEERLRARMGGLALQLASDCLGVTRDQLRLAR